MNRSVRVSIVCAEFLEGGNKCMKFIAEYKGAIAIGVLQWLVTTLLRVDRLFFTYDTGLEKTLYIWIKVLYLLFLIVFLCFISFVWKKCKNGEEKYIRARRVFFTYLIFAMLVMFFLWPGTWAWDDLAVLQAASYYEWLPWQHILTSVIQMVLLQILPFPGGIILMQNVIISVCVAYCVVKLETTFEIRCIKNKYIDLLVKLLPFVLPPVLMYQFSGYRFGLYVYLEVVLLCMVICGIKEKKEWGYPYVFLFVFLCVVVSAWRTESFLYVPMLCLLILFMKPVLSGKKMVFTIALIVIGFLGVTRIQNNALGNSNYEVISTLRPLAEMIRVSDPVEDAEYLEDIDKVIDLNIVYDNPEANGEELYWGLHVTRDNYSKEDYREYISAFVGLSIKYPQTVIRERMSAFEDAIGIHGIDKMVTNVDASAHLFDEVDEGTRAYMFQTADWVANKPIFPQLRKNIIYILGQRDDEGNELLLYRLIWNATIPIVVLVVAWIVFIIKRQWKISWLLLAMLGKIVLIILTQPASWIMYFLSAYLSGYVMLIYGIMYIIHKKQDREIRNLQSMKETR